MKSTLVEYKTISKDDLNLITITDDPEQVLQIMLRHHEWKNKQRHSDKTQ